MKFVRKKIIKGSEYYYLEFPLKIKNRQRIISKYLGRELPDNLKQKVEPFFEDVADTAHEHLPPEVKRFFAPKSTKHIEQARFWYQALHTELFQKELMRFRVLYFILFVLHSNRAEGSKISEKELQKAAMSGGTPKTSLEIEAADALAALNFAFSKKMQWNLSSIKKIHRKMFGRIAPTIAGKFKQENNTINNQQTTDWKKVPDATRKLLAWFNTKRKKEYPPKLALEFHYQFEAIHPFSDGNGRVGRLLFNAYLLQSGYMPVVFFTQNHGRYCAAISQAREGKKKKLAHYFVEQVQKTQTAMRESPFMEKFTGRGRNIGPWEIERGKIREV